MHKLSGHERIAKVMLLSMLGIALEVTAAGAPVEEIGPDFSYPRPAASAQNSSSQRMATQPAAPAANQAVIDLHYELQELRDEVRKLRGIVEEQANDLRELRQRQMDDYQDLDRRLSSAGGGGEPARAPAVAAQQQSGFDMGAVSEPAATVSGETDGGFTAVAQGGGAVASTASDGDDLGEYEAYTATYNLLKARKIDESVAGFKNQVAKYPNGKYTANAYYWLGEIYLLQNNLPEAEKAFAAVTTNFPAHRKAPDAMFKLAKVYHLEGQNDKAKTLLAKVANGSSSAAPLARAYLSENF